MTPTFLQTILVMSPVAPVKVNVYFYCFKLLSSLKCINHVLFNGKMGMCSQKSVNSGNNLI